MFTPGVQPQAVEPTGCAGSELSMDQFSDLSQHLLRFSPDALVVVDDRSQIRFANETCRQMFGHAPESLVGRPLDVLVPERLRGRHGQHVGNFLSKPNNREMATRTMDLFAVRADGSEFSAGIRLAPLRIGKDLFVAAAIRDMTEHRRMTEELSAAREEADRANRAKSRFLATASHDLRQPMQAIRLLNSALLKIVTQPQTRELLQHQSQAIGSMARLLNALLDISRLESGAVEPAVSNVSLADLFADLRIEFESVAFARNIKLQVDSPSLSISTDRTLLGQLLQNLLGNALKYTDRGFVKLGCSREEGALVITVEDSGIGIPVDKLERIFDEYYQVDIQGGKRMGVGLGLAIVKEVARLLGFSVWISSKVGEGTQACIRIPERLLVSTEPVSAASLPMPNVSARKPRVILVEDNDGVRLATEMFLRFEGHETVSASTVAKAEDLFAGMKNGDVVITDYHLDSNITGLDLLLSVRARVGRDVPGIVLSGDLPAVLRSVQSPVANCKFLSKPVDTAALVEAIAELSAVAADRN